MDDTELTYRFWRIRKTVMQVSFLYKTSACWKKCTADVRFFARVDIVIGSFCKFPSAIVNKCKTLMPGMYGS